MLSLLADIATLRHFYIVQNEYTRPLEPMPAVSWRRFSKANRFGIKLHLAISHSPGCLAGEDATEKVSLTYQIIPNSNHFFLWSRTSPTKKLLSPHFFLTQHTFHYVPPLSTRLFPCTAIPLNVLLSIKCPNMPSKNRTISELTPNW